jgi:hypothetical protein
MLPGMPPVDRTQDPAAAARSRANWYLGGALFLSLVLWNAPYGEYALYPFRLFGTWAHEFSHGLAMIVTGTGFDRMLVYPDTSGLAFPSGGSGTLGIVLVGSAGYVGTALLGALLLVVGATHSRARTVLAVLGGVMVLSAVVWVRNAFGIVAVGLLGAALVVAALRTGPRLRAFLVEFLAAQTCLNALLDIRTLFAAHTMLDGRPHGDSDARLVGRFVGGPFWLWAILWLVLSGALLFLALRARRRSGRGTAPAAGRARGSPGGVRAREAEPRGPARTPG